jgi:two-component system LytT family response regulator
MMDSSSGTAIRAIIVDDEPIGRANVATLLRADPEIEVIAECCSGAEAIEAVRNAKPELLFLDIQMPECDGFDVLEMLGRDAPPAIVFVTAYDRYAVKAFEAEALDYLLKPFSDLRFARTLARAKAAVQQRKGTSDSMYRLIVKSAGRVAFLQANEIDWIEAADYYACLHVGAKTHLLRRSLAELERDLDPKMFCRVHRSTIVNLGRVQEVRFDSSGEYEVLLRAGSKLRLSRRYQKQLQARLGSGRRWID